MSANKFTDDKIKTLLYGIESLAGDCLCRMDNGLAPTYEAVKIIAFADAILESYEPDPDELFALMEIEANHINEELEERKR